MRAFFRTFHLHFLLNKGETWPKGMHHVLLLGKLSDNHVLHFIFEVLEETWPKGMHHKDWT